MLTTDSKREGTRVEKDPFEIHRVPRLEAPCLIVSWRTNDPGDVGSQVTEFLIEKLGGQEVAEIRPLGFFPFGGVRFKGDLVQVPESKFWACEKQSLLIFWSDEPAFEHHTFLKHILDFAESHCHVKEFYTVNGAISSIPHSHSRRLLTVFNQPEFKTSLAGYGLEGMSWEGPPAISSYLLWVARRRGMPGVSLWPEIPFYLAAVQDAEAAKRVLYFLNHRFNLTLDLGRFEIGAMVQNERIAQLRKEDAETDQLVHRLESGENLNEEEQLKLTRGVYDVLRKEN
jgi:proteasome assembly chaperone (PAC2) family protein